MQTTPCIPCCSTPQTVNVPGVQGATGPTGAAAFTTTTSNFVTPAKGSSVTMQVASSAWVAPGMPIGVQNGTSVADVYVVTSVPNSTSIVATYLNYGSNANAGGTITAGSIVAPGGFQSAGFLAAANNLSDVGNVATALGNLGLGNSALAAYAVAGSQALTSTLTSTILSCTITLPSTGRYLLFGSARYDLAAASITSNTTTLTAKLRRTNNTPSDLANAVANYLVPTSTTLTNTAAQMGIPVTFYTGTTGDVLALVGGFTGAPTAGAINAVEGSILAIRLF